MLNSILIKNYAIIDDLTVDFKNGLNIITGETGAGKSIILGALGLILGNRADHSSLFNADKKCVIRGVFTHASDDLRHTLVELDIDSEDDDIILQREISSKGKSRAYVNDTPVNLKTLQKIGRKMVDLHMQFDQLDILEKKRQFEIVDAFGGQQHKVSNFQKLYHSWLNSKTELARLQKKKNSALREYDYIKFQADELSQAEITINEEEEIESQLSMLTHAESLTEHLQKINQHISESDESILNIFRSAVKALDNMGNLPEHIEHIKIRIDHLMGDLSDLAREAESLSNEIEYSPELIEELTERINLINTLTNKHHLNNTTELLNQLSTWTDQLAGYTSMDDEIDSLAKEIHKKTLELKKEANEISKCRKKNVKKIGTSITTILHNLEMKKAQFEVRIEPTEQLNVYGNDDIAYLFTANSGSGLQNIKNAASGGELSRLNLSLKSIVADKIDLQTMVLDEIDTGISGHVAKKMGLMLKNLAQKHQIVSITHSPQIAASGAHHLFVYKELVKEKTQTRIKILDSKERIHNIAIMLSENPPSKAAIKNAEELMEIT